MDNRIEIGVFDVAKCHRAATATTPLLLCMAGVLAQQRAATASTLK